ncbi:hypothetical protein [Streptomyces sanglieri]|uniref:hypothetical protein n=1 Tax=Streptomyces sanglieri TaxID=193460 RepID=UPI0035244297
MRTNAPPPVDGSDQLGDRAVVFEGLGIHRCRAEEVVYPTVRGSYGTVYAQALLAAGRKVTGEHVTCSQGEYAAQ